MENSEQEKSVITTRILKIQEIKNCTICNKIFKSKDKYCIYCYNCKKNKKNRKTIRVSNCLFCNKKFEHNKSNTKYCSVNCRNNLRYKNYKNILINRRQSLENTLKYIYIGAKSRSKKLNREFNITLEYLLKMLVEQNYKCAMTGIVLEGSKGGKEPFVISIDRIDNSKGYIEGNVQLVTTIFNTAKNHYKMEDLTKMCKEYIKYNKIII